MSLLHLPNELLLNIASGLQSPHEIYNLTLTSRRFASLLIPILHKSAVEDKDNLTALQWACSRGHEGLVLFLLKRGVDINFYANTRVKCRKTALFLAIGFRRKSPLVQILLDNGADLTITDEFGSTALHVAAQHDRNDIARLLLDRGADIEATNLWHSTPLHTAAFANSVLVVRSLLALGANINAVNRSGETPLHVCAVHNSVAVAELLLQHGAKVAARDHHGKTALHCASTRRTSAGVTKLLIANGADLTEVDNQEYTALDWALFANNDEVDEAVDEATIRLLLSAGVGIYPPHTLSGELLCWAVRCGHEDILKIILEQDIDVSVQDLRGRTPLYWAAWSGQVAIVNMLLEKGADISVRDGMRGRTALTLAAAAGRDAVVSLLLETSAERQCLGGARKGPALHGSIRGAIVDFED